ncbi:MAG: response regulator [Ruthenibacterium sp.]
MKVLIVDDERLIREGLLAQINWTALHIDTVLQADDGLHALEIAKKEKPEFVLTDVRMPRMDGIAFAEQFVQLLPESHIIFMSGYSDKDYLKAAIKLKAVSYVEKPVDCAEVEGALQEAICLRRLNERNKDAQNLRVREENGRLAVAVTRPGIENDPVTVQLCSSLGLTFGPATRFCTVLGKVSVSFTELEYAQSQRILDDLQGFAAEKNLSLFYAFKYNQYLIFHLYSDALTEEIALDFAQHLFALLCACAPFYISVGTIVTGLCRVYLSYQEAVLLIQSSFFREENSIVHAGEPAEEVDCSFLERCPAAFEAALHEKDADGVKAAACQLYLNLKNCCTLASAQVKDVYYRLFTALENAALEQQLSLPMDSPLYTAWEAVATCDSLCALHRLLLEKTQQLFDAICSHAPENQIVFMMKNYIRHEFSADTLSVKDVSDHVFLSAAYACTLFKAETGQTINQFITEFRLEKAKQLLMDPRHTIADISAQVGYADGNYFGKSFKRFVGLSPSEYREKMLP